MAGTLGSKKCRAVFCVAPCCIVIYYVFSVALFCITYLVFCLALFCILCCVLSSLGLRYVMFFVVLCCNALCCVLCCFLLHCIVLCCVLRATSPLLQDHPRQYGCAHWAHLALCTISINLSSLSQTCIIQFCSNNNPAKNYTLSCRLAEPIWPILHFVQFQ